MFQISRRVDYAIRIMIELGLQTIELPIAARRLSKKTGVPKAFLHKIAADLVKADLIQTHAGPAGGISLQHSLEQINLLQVVEAVDGPVCLNVCLLRPEECNRDRFCSAHDFWGDLQNKIVQQLTETTLEHLITRAKKLRQLTTREREQIPYLYARENIRLVTPPPNGENVE